ncbi:MAG: YicC family protein [Ignavibacteria bacterium]|nr:YicC family protein [Ignavibacteria bacterium]
MIVSMTGFGKSEGTFEKKKYSIEIRSVNSRFCEISFKYPRYLAGKDFELKEVVRKKITRGKLNINLNIEGENNSIPGLNIDEEQIKEYYLLLKKINGIINSDSEIKLEHILSFSNLFTGDVNDDVKEPEFRFICGLLNKALDDLIKMKIKEGDSLKKDILDRIKFIDKESAVIAKMSKQKLSSERERISEKVGSIVSDKKILDENRLEIEIILLAEKIDITEEVIRLKSHTKYFYEYAKSDELAGRRLNFLIQEINREINTIASKSLDAGISQKASVLKEELEKIREQLQNVE